jgi:hypothetical protein
MKQQQQKDGQDRYEKPVVRSEEVFETLALTCAKVDAQCQQPEGAPALQS